MTSLIFFTNVHVNATVADSRFFKCNFLIGRFCFIVMLIRLNDK